MDPSVGPKRPYANTLPNSKARFPPDDLVFKSDAPWAVDSGFKLPKTVSGIDNGCYLNEQGQRCCPDSNGQWECQTLQNLYNVSLRTNSPSNTCN